MSIRYRFHLLDENSRVLGTLHGDFSEDDAALACASTMLRGRVGIEVWRKDRLIGRLTQKGEAVDEIRPDRNAASSEARSERNRPPL
jgi:hypothetical protein